MNEDLKIVKAQICFTHMVSQSQLIQVDISPLSMPELTVLFINLYNALIVHATVVLGPASNLAQRVRFFANTKYTIGGLEYSGELSYVDSDLHINSMKVQII